MILVTRLNQNQVYLNPDLIRYIESTPDTMITLTTGETIMVREKIENVVELFVQYQKNIRGTIQSIDG